MSRLPDLNKEKSGMASWKRALLVVTGLLPLLGLYGTPPETMPLIYTVFVVVYLFRRNLTALIDRMPGSTSFHLFLLFLLAGSLTEILAWANNFLKAAPQPALFHPQLIPDLILGIGFYGGWAVAWLIALRWFRFTLWETFLVTGFQGIFFEQLGAVFLAMVRVFFGNPLISVVLGIYVCLVHGSIVGLAMAPVIDHYNWPCKSRHWVRFPIIIALMIGLAFLGTALVHYGAFVFGGLPPKRSIIEHPFW